MWETVSTKLTLTALLLLALTEATETEKHQDEMKTYGFGLAGNLYKRVKTDLMKKATYGDYLMKNYHSTIIEPMMAAIKLKMDKTTQKSKINEVLAALSITLTTVIGIYQVILHVMYFKKMKKMKQQIQN